MTQPQEIQTLRALHAACRHAEQAAAEAAKIAADLRSDTTERGSAIFSLAIFIRDIFGDAVAKIDGAFAEDEN